MHMRTCLIGPPCSKACGFRIQSQCRAHVLAARTSRDKHAKDFELCATNHSAQAAHRGIVAAPGCAAPVTATAADAAPSQRSVARRRYKKTSKMAVKNPGALHTTTPLVAVGAAADAAAHAAALTAFQLYPHMAAAFISSSTTRRLQGTGVSVTRQNQLSVVLTSRDIHGRKVTFRRTYEPVTDDHSCLVAAAAADLALLAIYGREKVSDAQLPSIFGNVVGRRRPRMMANLPLALYDDKDIQTWRALLQLEQPDIILHAVTLPVTNATAQPQLQGAAPQGRRQEPHKQRLLHSSQTAVTQQQQMLQQQNTTPDVLTAPTGLRKPPAAPSVQQQRKRIRAAAAAALATAVQRVLQHAEARPGTVANSLWAFEENPKAPRGSCVDFRRANCVSPWRARVTLPGNNWKVEVQKYCRSPLEAAVAADLFRLALHGRRQPSTSGCFWNFPKELYIEEQIHAFGPLIQLWKPDVVLSGME